MSSAADDQRAIPRTEDYAKSPRQLFYSADQLILLHLDLVASVQAVSSSGCVANWRWTSRIKRARLINKHFPRPHSPLIISPVPSPNDPTSPRCPPSALSEAAEHDAFSEPSGTCRSCWPRSRSTRWSSWSRGSHLTWTARRHCHSSRQWTTCGALAGDGDSPLVVCGRIST